VRKHRNDWIVGTDISGAGAVINRSSETIRCPISPGLFATTFAT